MMTEYCVYFYRQSSWRNNMNVVLRESLVNVPFDAQIM